MPNLSKPPSITDDGDWEDGIDEADCTICGEPLTDEEVSDLNVGQESNEDKLASALCGKCQRIENGEEDE